MMKKAITTMLISMIAMANVFCMSPAPVMACSHHSTCSSHKKACSKYRDKNHNHKCDKCGKKKSAHKKHH